jgi:methionyl-tRNA formyltransferase
MANSFRIIMMGTGPFAVPTFRALLDWPHQVLALVTRPDRPVHRREKAPLNPMREVAKQHNLEVFEPESINSPEAKAWLTEKAPDLFVVCDYGQILSRDTLGLARLGGINLHASLLPKYRGAAPINWAIYQGETETGVTVIHMTPQLDGGPCLVQRSTSIGPQETTAELEPRLAELGVSAVLEAINLLATGEATKTPPQDSKLATKAPRLKKEDGAVDWSRHAVAIFNQVRALQPWPKTFTNWQRPEGEPLRLILEKVTPLPTEWGRESASPELSPSSQGRSDADSRPLPRNPGIIVEASKEALIVACGEGALQIDQIQPAGKRAMSAAEFLRGHPIQVGDHFRAEITIPPPTSASSF